MRRILSLLVVGLVLTVLPAWSQNEAEDADGPRLFLGIGLERPITQKTSEEMLLQWKGGIEWPGIFGRELWFFGEIEQTGWGQEIADHTRYHWALKSYLASYWENAQPWWAVGVEHDGPALIVNQTNITWFAIGLEPELSFGWVQASWQASGWLMDAPNSYRFVFDFIPGGVLQ